MGSHSQYSSAGAVINTYEREGLPLSPGGSSGGSAVAVATALCDAALGTDTGGSVRLPASYTGIVGFKPSYGLLSRWGVIQYANSLDTVGILARETAVVRAVFESLNHYDNSDPTSLPPSLRSRLSSASSLSRPLRIGIPMTYNIAELSPTVREAYASILKNLQAQGHSLYPVTLDTTRLALSAYYVLAPAEASSNLAKYDGIRYGYRATNDRREELSASFGLPLYASTRARAFGPEVQRRVLLGAYTLSSDARENYFVQAQRVRRLVQQDFDAVFARQNPLLHVPTAHQSDAGPRDDPLEPPKAGVDVLLTPTAPTLPPTIEEVEKQSAVERYVNDVFTAPASLAGLPAVSVPVRLSIKADEKVQADDVSSTGLQIIGQFGDDSMVLEVAAMIEKMQKG